MSDDSERWPLSVYDIPHIRPLESDTPDECPICREPFNEEPIEEPVKINPLRCRHVFGHLCLAAHLYSDMPWSHTCPAYREVWYEPESAESYQTLGDEVAELRQLLQLWNNANVLNWALVTHLATQVRDNRYEIIMNALDTATVDLLLQGTDG
jgi:hypothetical protein